MSIRRFNWSHSPTAIVHRFVDYQTVIDPAHGQCVKSLMAFGFKLGFLRFDVGRALRVQTSRDELAERILSETEVLRILATENNPRNRAILRDVLRWRLPSLRNASLKWRHLQERDTGGQ